MMKKRITALFLASLMAATMLTGCGSDTGGSDTGDSGDSSATGETYTMTIAHAVAETHPSHITLLDFETAVEEGTGGAVQVDIVPNGALGGEGQYAEMLGLDALQATVIGADAASGIVPEWGLIGGPYLFDSRESAYAALDGEFGAELAALAESHNIYVAGWGDAGFRNVTNSRQEIVTPADMEGLKIRVMENDLHMALFREFGANPSPLAFNELFTALQQGTVDAQENPITVFTVSKFYEVQDYMTLTEHVYTAAPFLINKSWLESLPEEYQTVILDAAAEWTTAQRAAMEGGEEEHMQTCMDAGMEIRELTAEEKQVWMDAAAPLNDTMNEMYGEDLVNLARSFNG